MNISNPYDVTQLLEIPIWPVHCVQGTKGAEIIPQIDVSKFHHVLKKGMDSRVEMFSGFADVFGNKSSVAASIDLAGLLKDAGISHVFIVGLAGDYCVRCTALDAKKEGFEVFVVEEATKSVGAGEKGWVSAKGQLERAGIEIVHSDGPEIKKVYLS